MGDDNATLVFTEEGVRRQGNHTQLFGQLKETLNGEEVECLSILPDGDDGFIIADLLSEIFEEEVLVSVRYWVSEIKLSPSEMKEKFLHELIGNIDVEYHMKYSDITGYMWTDENLNVGGHDLLSELKSYCGNWLYMEIETHPVIDGG